MRFFFFVLRVLLRILYFFLKLFPVQNKIVFISRASEHKPLDFVLLEKEIQRRDPEMQLVFLCNKSEAEFQESVKSGLFYFRCMRELATARACMVERYCIPVSILKHRKSLVVVQVWHSLGAVKKFGYQTLDTYEGKSRVMAEAGKMHQNYSYITCASEVTRQIYAEAFRVPAEQIFVEGMPRIDYIVGSDLANYRIRERVYRRHPQLREKKTILYVPTFRKNATVDLAPILENVDTNKYNLLIKLHPMDTPPEQAGEAIFSSMRTPDLMKASDYFITDYSGTAFEACVLNKPLFFYVPDYEDYNVKRGLNVDLFEEYPDCTFKRFSDLMKVLGSGYYNYQELAAFRDRYVQTADTKNCKRIVNHLFEEMERYSS